MTVGPGSGDGLAPIERVLREEWGRLLALLLAQYRRLDLAEDALADAFATAAERWPRDGMPSAPAAWLLTAARRRVLDRLRSEAVAARKAPVLVVDARVQAEAERAMVDPGDLLEDERLRLVLLTTHPALAPEAASALTLRLVLGVPTSDIARLFLVGEATMAARLTRARKKLVAAGIPYAVPDASALPGRLEGVVQVAYLGFTAGYAPGSGPGAVRVELAGEAVRLGAVLRDLLPDEPLPALLLALMLLQHSRRDARTEREGLVLLPDQDRARWRHDEIASALTLLTPFVDGTRPIPAGIGRSYYLQSLIAAEHATARTAQETRWDRIAALYAELEDHTGSPVVRLNRAVAVAEAEGPRVGLVLLDGLELQLPGNHRLPATRAELLRRAGDNEAAGAAYEVAIGLCSNEIEQRHLERRRAELPPATPARGQEWSVPGPGKDRT